MDGYYKFLDSLRKAYVASEWILHHGSIRAINMEFDSFFADTITFLANHQCGNLDAGAFLKLTPTTTLQIARANDGEESDLRSLLLDAVHIQPYVLRN